MINNKIFKIDIGIHYRIYNMDLENSVEKRYKKFLDNARVELLTRAVIEGIFDYTKYVKIGFRKIPYDEGERIRAIDYLIETYRIDDHYDLRVAIKKAHSQYEKIKPFNLVMLFEEEE